MDQLWYYEDHGRAIGPVTGLELVKKIKAGEITLVDLVFKEGQMQWLPVQSHEELMEMLGAATLQDASDWIVLKTVNVDGKDVHEQVGPFNATQILDLLDKGKIRFSDYVWREGYSQWVPLGRVDEFEQPLKSSVQVDRTLYTKPRQNDLLAKAESIARPAPLKKITPIAIAADDMGLLNDKPPEASGEDLVQPKWKVSTKIVNKTEIVRSPLFEDEKTPAPLTLPSSVGQREMEAQLDHVPLEMAEEALAGSNIQKISTGDMSAATGNLKENAGAVVQKISSVFAKMQNTVQVLKRNPSTSAGKAQETASDTPAEMTGAHKEDVQRRWVHVGVVACVMVIICVLAAMMSIGKKKLDSRPRDQFSIKMEAPSSDVQKQAEPAVQQKNDAKSADVAPVVKAAVPASAKKSTAASKEEKSPASTRKSADLKPTVSGSFKNKSYFHHKERIYIFYTAGEGERLAADLQKASRKHEKSSKQWKSFYGGWKGKAKNYASKVGKEAKKAKLHRKLFHQLATSADELEDLGRDLDVQITKGRGPSRVASAKTLESQFKNIHNNAKSLDR